MCYLTAVAILAGAYFAAGSLGQILAIPPGSVTAVWPPSGIALAAILIGGRRLWPGIWLGAFLVNVRPLLDPTTTQPIAISLAVCAAIATGSTVQALVGGSLVARLAGGRHLLDQALGIFRFTAVAVLMCLIASVVGTSSLALGGFIPRTACGFTWLTWWLGDTAGVIVVAPPILAWSQQLRAGAAAGGRIEAAAFLILLLAAGQLIFGHWPFGEGIEAPAAFLAFPLLMWAAFRFGQRGASTAVLIMTAMAVLGRVRGSGPFQDLAVQESLWLLQTYGGVLAVSTLALSAVVAERHAMQEVVNECNRGLERRVAERTAEAEERSQALARSEAAHREQAGTLRSILENILEGIVVADARGAFVLCNPAAERLVGVDRWDIPPEEWPSQFGCFLPDQVTPYPAGRLPLARALRGETVAAEDLYLCNPSRPDGVWLRLSAVPLRNAEGEPVGAVAVFRDISESKQAELRLKSVVESALAGFVMVDEAGRITLVNRQAEVIFGYAREELLGQPLGILVPEHLREDHLRHIGNYLHDPESRPMATSRDIRGRRKDGHAIDLLVALNPIRQDGRLSILASVLDVTEQKRAVDLVRSVVEFSPDGTIAVDRDGRITLVNRQAEVIFGYAREELLGQPVGILLPERARDHHQELSRQFVEERRHRSMNRGRDLFARRKDGSEFPADIALHSYELNGEGFAIANVRDMTERLRAEEALRQSEARFRAISEAAPLGIFLSDARGDCLYTNRAYLELTGRTAEEALGECWKDIIHPEDRERVFAAWYQAAHDRVPFEMTYRFLHRDGRTIWVSSKSAEIRVGDALSGYVGVVEDVTQKREAAEAIRRSEERFDLAVRGTDAGIWDWDLRAGTVYFSPRWKSMLGYAEDEISNAFPEWESRVHPEDRERASRAIRDYLENRSEEYELEHRLRHKDGSYRWILSRGAAVRDGAERASRMVGSHIDITAQKHTAEQLNEKLVQLRAARKIQQTLLPKRSPDLAGLDIAGFSEPAAYAGGDMYDYLTMVGGHLGVVVGDVSGHGIGAALQMASTSAFLRSLAQTCATIGEIMTRVNGFVYEGTDEEFVTLVLARIDLRSRTLTYANAGHPTGYILDAAGVVRAELGSSTIPLGIEGHLDFPVGAPIVLWPGDLIVLVTDGILEAESPEGKPFGEARMLEVVRSTRDGSSREILETLRLSVGHHSRIESPRDDLTAVVIKLSDQST